MVDNNRWGNLLAHAILIFGVALVIFPVYVAIIASTHPPGTFLRGVMPLLPGPNALENYRTVIFEGRTALDQMKRTPADLADWLCRELTFATGADLLTGTGIVPDNDITLQAHDQTRIRIAPIGELVNTVAAH